MRNNFECPASPGGAVAVVASGQRVTQSRVIVADAQEMALVVVLALSERTGALTLQKAREQSSTGLRRKRKRKSSSRDQFLKPDFSRSPAQESSTKIMRVRRGRCVPV